MKRYCTKTRFGYVDIYSRGLHEVSLMTPYKVYFENRRYVYPDIVSVFNRRGRAKVRDKRKLERFMVAVWHLYVELAIEEMILHNAKIPITNRGNYMAIGVNKLAPARRDYKFNPLTVGVVYEPVIVFNSIAPKGVKFYYRIRFHPLVILKFGKVLNSGKLYHVQPSSPMLQKVNKFYEERKLKRLKEKSGIENPYPYAIRL